MASSVTPPSPVAADETGGGPRQRRTDKGFSLGSLSYFLGPALLVSIGYIDPGNWSTDIYAGSAFGYSLIWVLLVANIMAVLLQSLAARLGVVTGKDLAEACAEMYPSVYTRYSLWILCEIAIAAMDMAEVLGTAIGLTLLFGLPTFWGVLITVLDTLLFLLIEKSGARKIEAIILFMLVVVLGCFFSELAILRPAASDVVTGFLPSVPAGSMYVIVGMIGATVMPHNFYLHSWLVQSRSSEIGKSTEAKSRACVYNLIDSALALNIAFFINMFILVVAAAAFHSKGYAIDSMNEAYRLLGSASDSDRLNVAPTAFALGLLIAGQSSTLTGTLAGQVVMQGFVNLRMAAWKRQMLTRSMAIIPAAAVIFVFGDGASYTLLIFSQVVLSIQLPFAIVPLIKATSCSATMGAHVNPLWLNICAWTAAVMVIAGNVWLVIDTILNGSVATKVVLSVLCVPTFIFLAWLVWVRIEPLQTKSGRRKRRRRRRRGGSDFAGFRGDEGDRGSETDSNERGSSSGDSGSAGRRLLSYTMSYSSSERSDLGGRDGETGSVGGGNVELEDFGGERSGGGGSSSGEDDVSGEVGVHGAAAAASAS